MKKNIVLFLVLICILVGGFWLIKENKKQDVNNKIEEKILVENFVRENIKTIATNEEVLGGSWYVTSIFTDEALNQGTVTYEDGHIESKATFSYDFDEKTGKVTVLKFEIQK
jgi:hypothetical protein